MNERDGRKVLQRIRERDGKSGMERGNPYVSRNSVVVYRYRRSASLSVATRLPLRLHLTRREFRILFDAGGKSVNRIELRVVIRARILLKS